MDIKVSRKEQRWQPRGPVMELVDDVFDLYLVHGNAYDQKVITDIEILDSPEAELLDRAMFSVVKQRGADPLDAVDGIQWAEYVMGELPPALILSQIQQAVYAEGPGVKIVPEITSTGTSFTVSLTKSAQGLMV